MLFKARALLAAATLLAPSTAMATPAWPEIVKAGSWLPLGADAGEQTFYRLSAPTRLHQLWVRYELKDAQTSGGFSFNSYIDLDQFDCSDGSFVVVQETLYSENNLRGQTQDQPLDSKRRYAKSGAIGGEGSKIACALRFGD